MPPTDFTQDPELIFLGVGEYRKPANFDPRQLCWFYLVRGQAIAQELLEVLNFQHPDIGRDVFVSFSSCKVSAVGFRLMLDQVEAFRAGATEQHNSFEQDCFRICQDWEKRQRGTLSAVDRGADATAACDELLEAFGDYASASSQQRWSCWPPLQEKIVRVKNLPEAAGIGEHGLDHFLTDACPDHFDQRLQDARVEVARIRAAILQRRTAPFVPDAESASPATIALTNVARRKPANDYELTTSDAARELAVTPQRVNALCTEGKLEYRGNGRARRISKRSVARRKRGMRGTPRETDAAVSAKFLEQGVK